MTAVARFILVLALASPLAAGCSSWDTGSPNDRSGEIACFDTVEALARAAERCNLEYKRSYDLALLKNANGDCQNVTSVRNEAQLRNVCIPSLATTACSTIENAIDPAKPAAELHPSCSTQLQRPL
jgi:hypothetical protein